MNLTLMRANYGSSATTGGLTAGDASYFAIEPPWRNDEQGHSCVPEGVYDLIPYLSPAHGHWTWYLENRDLGVGGVGAYRSFCELHSANWARQLQGCIAAGLEGQPMLDPATGAVEPAVERSVDAIAALTAILGPQSIGHTLAITSAGGPPT